MEVKVAAAGAVTVKTVEPEMLPTLAEMVDVPTATAVASPLPLTVATPPADVAQAAVEVTSVVVPSLLVAVAESCTVEPFTAVGFDGVTATEDTVGGDVAGGPDCVDAVNGAPLPPHATQPRVRTKSVSAFLARK